MISRKTARSLAEAYVAKFTYADSNSSGYYSTQIYHHIDWEEFYDFIYEHDFELWFCNKAKSLMRDRQVKDLIMGLHTGETQYSATTNWKQEDRQRLGQRVLEKLAEDILNDWERVSKKGTVPLGQVPRPYELLKRLELDGYTLRNGRLLTPEEDVLNAQAEASLLETLFTSLRLANKDTVLHHLELSEEHYIASKWDDSISNSRKFLESVLQEVAAAYSLRVLNIALPTQTYSRPVEVRKYLEDNGIIDTKEREAIQYVYGLLSEKGGHPQIATNDQARLLRHLALTFSQYIMLNLESDLKKRGLG